MKLGEYVIPSNRQMLYTYKTFQVTDTSKER
jgi:hypothetical protein